MNAYTLEDPLVKWVNQIFLSAVNNKASDIHIEPYQDKYRIRYRQDGLLIEVTSLPLSKSNQVIARIKVMANLDLSERRIPQDGRFKLPFSHTQSIDFRVSTCPTVEGEKIVIRILDLNLTHLDIETLGLNKIQQSLFLKALKKPQGMILVTGPTGSGKTISLYSALRVLNTEEKNILTVEDPIEIKIKGINQVNVNPKIGLTFSLVLRAFLRQDPDIIMIGEIRDLETAEIAIKAAQTGHLVLTTLHTNTAAEALTRLMNMGIAPFNMVNSINLVIAQRLVRRLCLDCQANHHASTCTQCVSGYQGRIGLFELMPISDAINQLIIQGKTAIEIHQQARKEGMLSLYESGLEKIKQRITTIDEVTRVGMSDE